MITDLAFLLRQAPVCRALDGRITPEQFRDQLNHHIHGYGSLGYEEAEKMNLRVSSKYTKEEAQELLEQIKISRETKTIDVQEIDEIPFGIAYDLASATNSGAGTIEKAKNSAIKYGAKKGFA